MFETVIPVPRLSPRWIAQPSGPLGTNAQYLFSLEQALQLGMHDASLDDLVASVRALLARVRRRAWPERA